MAVDTITEHSNRSKILFTQLENYEPGDERGKTSLQLIRNLLTNSFNDDIFDREQNLHHITGSAFVVAHGGLLLHFHKKIKLWLQPGGHLDPGEFPRDAAIRETYEETGISITCDDEIFHVDVHETPSGHTHYDIRYVAYSLDTALRPQESESQKVAWFSPSALATLTDPALTGAIEKLIQAGKFLRT